MKHFTLTLAMAVSLTSAACLQKDTTSTIYLRQDGSFDWVVLERNVRSDEADGAARLSEESAYVAAVDRGEHDVAEGFLALGAEDVRVRWLRNARPYAVMVDGRFDDLAAVFDRPLMRCGIPHEVSITHDGELTTWRLRADVGPEGEGVDFNLNEGCDDGLDGLADALAVTIVLESGRFTDVTGFKLEGSDTATFDEEGVEAAAKATGRFELALSWR